MDDFEEGVVPYVCAISIAAFAVTAGHMVWPALMIQALAVIVSAVGFGWQPGLVTALLTWSGTAFFLMPRDAPAEEQLNVALFAAMCLLAVWAGGAQRASRKRLLRQATQQAALAEMGRRALSSEPVPALVQDAVGLAARALEVEFSHFLQYDEDGRSLILQAGVGFEGRLVGKARLDLADEAAGPSYLVPTWGPFVLETLDARHRYPPPPWLHEHGARQGLRSAVPGDGSKPLGVLGVYTRDAMRRFNAHDVHFLEGMAVILSSIVARARADRTLAEQMEVQSSLLRAHDALHEGIAVVDGDRVALANDAFLQLLGMSLAEVRVASLRALVEGCDLDDVPVEARAGVLLGRAGPVPVEVYCTPFQAPSGETRTAVIVRDVRDRLRMEEQLRQAVERATREAAHLSGVLDALPIAVTIADEHGRVVTVNPAMRELWGEGVPLAPSLAHYGVYRARYRDTGAPVSPHEWALARALLTGESVPRQHLVIQRFDGAERFVANSAAPLKAPDGRQLGAVAVNIDETREVQAMRELEALKSELEARVEERTAELALANRELEAFSYTVAHDLRGPLRAISGFAGAVVADHGDQLPELARQHLGRVQAAVARMDDLIGDLLRLSRVTRAPLQRQPTDLSALAAEVAAGLRERDPARRVEVDIEPGMTVQADPELVRVLFENLLGNAWKFTRPRDPARIEVGTERDTGATRVVVRDNGIGFDQAFADRIFQPFERLADPAVFEGAGIGLSIVHRVVDRHGGWIRAEGVPGRGATFRFTLAPD